MPASKHREALIEATRDVFRSSLYHTAKFLCGYSKMQPRTHVPMVRNLESDTKRKLIVMPRGTFKSSIGVVAYPIWCLLRDPNERILIDSEVYTNSKNFLREIRAHYEGDRFRMVFGDWTTGGTWNEGEILVNKRTIIKKEASITASGVGAIKVGQHYERIISDDLNSNKNSATSEGRQKVIQHLAYNMSILDPQGTSVVIGTRYASDDAIGHIIETQLTDEQRLEVKNC